MSQERARREDPEEPKKHHIGFKDGFLWPFRLVKFFAGIIVGLFLFSFIILVGIEYLLRGNLDLVNDLKLYVVLLSQIYKALRSIPR